MDPNGKTAEARFNSHQIFGFAALGGLSWLADAFIDVHSFDGGSLAQSILHPGAHELFSRALGVTATVAAVALAFLARGLRGRARASLHASDTKFHALASAAHDAVILMDGKGRIDFWNAAAERIFGYTVAEALGRDVHRLLAPAELLPTIHKGVAHFQRTGTGAVTGQITEWTAIHRDGSRFPVELSVSTVQIDGEWQSVGIVRDLAPVKEAYRELGQAYRVLAASHREWMEIFDSVQDPIFLHDREGRVLRANRAYAALAGVPVQEICGRPYWELFPKRHAPLPGCLRTMRNAEHRAFDEITLENGSVLHSRAFAVHDSNGQYRHSLHILEDITAQRQAEVALREREARLSAIFEGARNVALMVTDLRGKASRILEFNSGAEAIFGYPREEVKGCPVARVLLPEDVARLPEVIEAMSRRCEGFNGETTLVRRGGQRFPALLSTYPIRGDAGEMVGILIVSLDISELKRAEEALQRNNEKLEAMFSSTHVLMACLDPAFNFVRVNAAYAEASGLGIPPEEFAGRNHFVLFPEEATERIFRRVVETGEPFSATATPFEHATRGMTFWDWALSPTQGSDGRVSGLLFTLIDATDRERRRMEAEAAWHSAQADLERRVVERTAELEAINMELESFSYSVSHDLRGPLRAINGFAEMLREDYGDRLDATGRDYLKRLRDATVRMAELVDGMLGLSRVMRTDLECGVVDLSALAADIARQLQATDPQRAVAWQIQPGLSISGDRALLGALLQNLLDNAWKFTSRRDQAHILFGEEWQGSRRVFLVRDNGAGFEGQYAHKLFTPFERLHSSAEYEGTGIGLATVRRIIQRHGGEAWAEGEVDKGATVFFSLPVRPTTCLAPQPRPVRREPKG